VGVCPGLYDDPHRRSLTGGAHSSSRLAPMTLTHLSQSPNLTTGVARIQARSDRHRGSSAHGANLAWLGYVRRHPVDG